MFGGVMFIICLPCSLLFTAGEQSRKQKEKAKFALWLVRMRNIPASDRRLTGKTLKPPLNRIAQFCIIIGVTIILVACYLKFGAEDISNLIFWLIITCGIGIIFYGGTHYRLPSPHRCPHCDSELQKALKVPIPGGPVILCTVCGTVWIPHSEDKTEINPSWSLNAGLFGAVGGLISLATGPAIQRTKGTPVLILIRGAEIAVRNEASGTQLPAEVLKKRKEAVECEPPLHSASIQGETDIVGCSPTKPTSTPGI
jgi:hypothetical protein